MKYRFRHIENNLKIETKLSKKKKNIEKKKNFYALLLKTISLYLN